MAAAHETMPAAGEHTLTRHAEAERPSTPAPMEFGTERCPPENRVDRSARFRLPVLKLRPGGCFKKTQKSFRSLGQAGRVLIDFSAPPRTSSPMFLKPSSFPACGRAGVGASLPEIGIWLRQAVAHCDAAEHARSTSSE
ncbi:hypothetical protein T484DRAFT_1905576 [Baffinella frigidus]|nr:hypothetical protein T484DRAFT_1905576 [Cryptophyta sp. CCMP2293]